MPSDSPLTALRPEDETALASLKGRLQAACGEAAAAGPVIVDAGARGLRVNTTPPINRSSMAPDPWRRHGLWQWRARILALLGRLPSPAASPHTTTRRAHDTQAQSPDPRGHWQRAGTVRRAALALVVAMQTYLATEAMTSVLPYHGSRPLELVILVLFAILSCWVSAGFWMALMGFVTLLTGRDRYAISATAAGNAAIDPQARTAIVMPICNEDVSRVFAGLRATYESLARTGELPQFDFFVLSDTNNPDTRVAEIDAWTQMCREMKAFGRVFYRWRQHRIKRKSGNIGDFCRRWGRNYRYMVILDADSVMSGKCLVSLVRMMEANPNAGIIQSAPSAAGHNSLYARIQQFANRVYGPLFVAGLHYFELGEAHYWGHNAIIRTAPFIEHCALARLPGRGVLSGEILSHDFVEAALMRRAGWAVWIAYDLPGSHEEMPPNLIDELKRDRRWCQGNLINFRLSFARGLHPSHRAVFLTGAMAYVSAPLWFAFLLLSTALLALHTLVEPQYFVRPSQLFPVWPEWHPERGVNLYIFTATLLFLPKILGLLLIVLHGAREFGGRLRLAVSVFAEMLFSALLAPVRMLFHTQFVVGALTGWKVQWKSPPREDTETTWSDALRHHGVQSMLGICWAVLVYWLNPAFLWWLLPVVGALAVSVPLSVCSSRVALGRQAREYRFFLTPEESHPPRELRSVRHHLKRAAPEPSFVDAVVDPLTNALVSATGAARLRGSDNGARATLVEKALHEAPERLTARDRTLLLRDAIALSQLHARLPGSPAEQAWLAAAARPPTTLASARTQLVDDVLPGSTAPSVPPATEWPLGSGLTVNTPHP
ncbi:MAG TPA: glucans biosynthesis glucosyltransferase MdoH [Burkholderiales bacterium]|nr:glucans biosynthesis glucosyltransferase MdoH [Burkholderiales bacterium]